MKLILHAGTHKTGTTSIQTALATNREYLKKQGIIYPDSIYVYGKSVVNHVPFSYSLTEAAIDDKEKSSRFVDFLQKCQNETPNSKILLSAEQFYRHIYGHDYWGENTLPKDSNYWDLRTKYIKNISTALSSFDVEIILFVREKDSFIESLFKELRKTGRNSGEKSEFIENFSPMFDFERQIGLFQKYFQLIQIVNYELSKKSGLIKYFFNLISCPMPEGVDSIWENKTP